MAEPRFEFDKEDLKDLYLNPEEIELAEAEKVYKKFGLEGRQRQYWANIARIAIVRFSELQKGKSIFVNEIKKRLLQIKLAGYNTETYSNMNGEEISNYFFKEVRPDIYKNAGNHCPSVLREIKKENEQRRLEAYL